MSGTGRPGDRSVVPRRSGSSAPCSSTASLHAHWPASVATRNPRMTEPRRVVITGIGTITPIGTGVEAFWSGLRACRSAVGAVTRFDPEPFRTKVAAEVRDFRPQDFLEERRVKRLDRCSQFTLGAARLAIADAALDLAREDRERVGVMMGSAL